MVITDDRLAAAAERELLSRARDGDAQAFCSLIEPLQGRLFRQAVALSGDLTMAEDIVSETLVAAWKSLPRYEGTCRLSTWLYSILLHRHLNCVRYARSRPVSLARLSSLDAEHLQARQDNHPSPDPLPPEAAAQKETAVRLRNLVDRLPEKHRRIIMLRYFEDASLSDMAAALSCSLGTIKSRLHHALEKLRKMNQSFAKGDTQL